MKKKIGDILTSIIIFAIGICLLFWSQKVIMAVSILLGALFIIYGLITIIRYFRYDPKSIISFMSAIISIIIGVLLLLKPNIISETISFVIGIFIIISGINNMANAIEFKGNNYRINIGLSIAAIVLGILCVLGKLLVPNIMLEVLGILLIIFSVTNVINSVISS